MTTSHVSAAARPRPHASERPRRRGLVSDPLWYKDAVIYEVRARSYFDSDGDGMGDLRGLTAKLDYLADLGITALWLLPHYPSPGRDDGYDIADYFGVHPDLGTLEDFDELVRQAHARGLRVITELVLNHTSDQHPWFQRARRAPAGSPERDFYVWSDTADRYTGARIIFRDFEPSNWTWDAVARQYYWHRFYAHQPDLNFDNPVVHDEMLRVVDFWFERGVDALRLDAVPYLYEREGTNCENLAETHAYLKKLRAHVDAKFPERMLLAEANQWPEDAAAYFGSGDECHMNFHFPIMPRLFMALHLEDRFPILDILRQTPELHESCQWAMFLRNHDELTLEMVTDEERDSMYRAYAEEREMRINLGIRRRLAPLVGNDRRKMELLNALLFSLPGTPVLYYGDEIGMGDNVYLGDRNGVRTPMQWSRDRNGGFSSANPQKLILPVIIDPDYHYEAINVEAQQASPSSLLWWTKRMIGLRKRFKAFGRGTVDFLQPSNSRVLAFVRRHEDEVVLVVVNLSRFAQCVDLDLSPWLGAVPVELVGGSRFPAVDQAPYRITLGGHAFYWFSLEVPKARESRASLDAPIALAASSVESLFAGTERPVLEDAVTALFVEAGLVERAVTDSALLDAVDLGRGVTLLVARFAYVEGEPEVLALPLVAVQDDPSAPGSSALAEVTLPADGETPERRVALVDARRGGVGAALLGTFRDVARGARGGSLAARVSGAAVDPDAPLRETRVVATDGGATLLVDDQVVVRVLARLEEGVLPELEACEAIGRVRGPDQPLLVPPPLGTLDVLRSRRARLPVATFEAYVPHEGTAWDRARGEAGRLYEAVLTGSAPANAPALPTSLLDDEPPPEARDAFGSFRDLARTLGARAAELHRTLASVDDPAFVPEPYGAMDLRSKYQTARNRVGRVVRSLNVLVGARAAGDRSRSDEVVALASRVLASEASLYATLEPLLGAKVTASRVRTHGDLRLDRALDTGRDYVFTTAAGSTTKPFSDRRRKGSALRDVATLVGSIHEAALSALDALRPEDRDRVDAWGDAWHAWSAAAFAQGWLANAAGAPFVPAEPAMQRTFLAVHLLERTLERLARALAAEGPGADDAVRFELRALVRRLPAAPT